MIVRALASQHIELLYPDCVLNETISVLARRCHEQGRSDAFAGLLDALESHAPSASITWISKHTEALYADTFRMVRCAEGALNFHDALIAAYCSKVGINYIASFDRDFDLVAQIHRLSTPEDVLATTADE